MAAQLFPLLDRSVEAFNQQQALRNEQVQQQQLQRENMFRQHAEALQQASTQSELAPPPTGDGPRAAASTVEGTVAPTGVSTWTTGVGSRVILNAACT